MKSSKFSQTDEKNFLESYANWTVDVRPYLIKILCDKFKLSDNDDEKEQIRILAIEQFMLFYETFQAFFIALMDRYNKPFLDSLDKDIETSTLYNNLKDKTSEQILEELNINLNNYDNETQKEIIILANLWQNEKICTAIKNLIPIFNKIKHKLLIYKNRNGNIEFVLEDSKKPLEKFYKNYQNQIEPDSDIDYFEEMAQIIKKEIQAIIKIRLNEIKN